MLLSNNELLMIRMCGDGVIRGSTKLQCYINTNGQLAYRITPAQSGVDTLPADVNLQKAMLRALLRAEGGQDPGDSMAFPYVQVGVQREDLKDALRGLENKILSQQDLTPLLRDEQLDLLNRAREVQGLNPPQLNMNSVDLAFSALSAPLDVERVRITASIERDTGILQFNITSSTGAPLTAADYYLAYRLISKITGQPLSSFTHTPDLAVCRVPGVAAASLNQWLTTQADNNPVRQAQATHIRQQLGLLAPNPVVNPHGGAAPILPLPVPRQQGGVQVHAVDLFQDSARNALRGVVQGKADEGWQWDTAPNNANDPGNQKITIKCGTGRNDEIILIKSTDNTTNQVTTQIITKHLANCAKMAELIAPLRMEPIRAVGVAVFHTGNDVNFMVELTKKMLDKGFAVKLEFAEPNLAPPHDRATAQAAIDRALTGTNVPNSNPPKTYKAQFDEMVPAIPEPARGLRFSR